VRKTRIEAPKNKAVIYIRVSTQEQVDNLSLGTQERRCRDLCGQQGWNVLHVFREEGKSAKTTKRDEFQRMIGFCRDRKNGVGHIVVFDLSRFARNLLDQLTMENEFLQAGIRIESVLEPMEHTAAGRWHRNQKALWNQYDNELRAERTITGMTEAARKGRFPFKAPVGYINVSQHKGQNLIPDPKTAPLIAKAFELMSTGLKAKAEVLRQVNDLGLTTRKGRPLSVQTFHKILANPIYAGWVTIPKWGLKFSGSFESLVSQHLFDTVQDVLRGKKVVASAHQRNNPDFPLRVFLRCGICGQSITGAWSTGRKKKYAYYRCRRSKCDLAMIPRDDLEVKFIELLKQLTPVPELVTGFATAVRDQWKRRQGDAEASYEAIQQRLTNLKERKDKLIDLRLDGEINQVAYKDKDARLNTDIEAAEQELRQAESKFLDLEGVLSFAEKIITSPARLWLESSLDQRQRLQGTFFPNGITFDGKGFGTASSSLFFSLLGEISEEESSLASPTGFEPVLSP
jgi:site-specific DNA recombinase